MIWLRSGGKMTERAYERLMDEAVPRWLDGGFLEGNTEIAARLWNGGRTQGQIAEGIGCSTTVVRELLCRAREDGIELRPYRGRVPCESGTRRARR